MNSLLYSNLNLIFLHIFPIDRSLDIQKTLGDMIAEIDNSMQNRIFDDHIMQESIVKKYILPGFSCNINLDSIDTNIQSEISVDISIYFNRIAVIRYYLPLKRGNYDKSNLCTDELIQLASLNFNDEDGKSYPNVKTSFDNIVVGKIGTSTKYNGDTLNSFAEVKRAYKQLFFDFNQKNISNIETCYTYIDIYGEVLDKNGQLKSFNVDDRISYIANNMSQELSGLLLLNHKEWSYGRKDIKGIYGTGNIALDNDELVLLNEKVCVALFLYEERKGLADWSSNLNPIIDRVKWPELLVILESILIRKFVLDYTSDAFRKQAAKLVDKNTSSFSVEKSLIDNAYDRTLITTSELHLNSFKKTSHQIIAQGIIEKFDIERRISLLNIVMQYIDDSLTKISDAKKLRQSYQLNVILALLSSASVLGLLFQQVKPPVLQKIFGITDTQAEALGVQIIVWTIFVLIFCLSFLFKANRNSLKK